MCGKKVVRKVFGGGSSTKEQPTPAVAQATPQGSAAEATSEINVGSTNTVAKGKKKLIINGGGTGVNL